LLAKASQYSAFIRTSQEAASGAFNQHAIDQMNQDDGDEDGDEGGTGLKRKKGGKVRQRLSVRHSKRIEISKQFEHSTPSESFSPFTDPCGTFNLTTTTNTIITGLEQEEEKQSRRRCGSPSGFQ
jgi:hypothetical protein